MCYPDKSLEEEPLFPAFAGHVPWPCHAFPELLCTVVPAANVLQSCKPRSVSSHHCMLQWGCGVHTAPAHCPHEWSTGNAAGEQYRRAPMQPSGKGLVFHASTLIPLLQAGCSCRWCLRLQHPRLLLITWQGQLLVNAGVSLSSCLACCKPLFPGHTQQCLVFTIMGRSVVHRAPQRWMLEKGAVRGQIFLVSWLGCIGVTGPRASPGEAAASQCLLPCTGVRALARRRHPGN